MNYYRNKKTGAVVKSICKITGENWEPMKPKETGKTVPAAEEKKSTAADKATTGEKKPAAPKTATDGKKATAGKKDAKA